MSKIAQREIDKAESGLEMALNAIPDEPVLWEHIQAVVRYVMLLGRAGKAHAQRQVLARLGTAPRRHPGAQPVPR